MVVDQLYQFSLCYAWRSIHIDMNTVMLQGTWKHSHPFIQSVFYAKCDEPTDLQDCKAKQEMHQHSYEDFELQVQICELELEALVEPDGEYLEYALDQVASLKDRKRKLLMSKRFHHNARKAYWWWGHMEAKASQR